MICGIFGFYVFAVRWVEPNEISFSFFFVLFFLLLLAVSIFAWYFSLCLYPDMSNALGLTESFHISSEKDNDKSRDSIESRSCLMIGSGWLDSMFKYFV